MELQSAFGVDVAMALDVCPAFPAERGEIEEACRRTLAWAERGRRAYAGPGLLFGIVQGGTHEDLRRRSAEDLRGLDFPGYAVGGVAVGESKEAIRDVTALTAPLLPEEKPRYLMGVGTPADLLASVRAGIDLFDCVLPTRNGRMGHAYTSRGEVTIKHERFKEDLAPLDPDCACPVCRRHSRAYLRNLFVLKDFSAPMLLSMHNVYFYLAWMREIRDAITEGPPGRARRAAGGEAARGGLKLCAGDLFSLTPPPAAITSLPNPFSEVPVWKLPSRHSSSRGEPAGSIPSARPSSTAPAASRTASSSSVATASRHFSGPRGRSGGPRRDAREQLARASRGVLRGAPDRGRARPDQLPPDGRRRRVHPGAQRRPRRLRATPTGSSGGRPIRGAAVGARARRGLRRARAGRMAGLRNGIAAGAGATSTGRRRRSPSAT